MSQLEIVIIAARRTPIGALGGALSPMAAHALGATVIRKAMEDMQIAPDLVDEIILGQVPTAGQGMNPARQASRLAGLADASPAALINQVCGSGLRAVALAMQQIQTGSVDIVVAGGQESVSNAPHVALLRAGKRLGDLELRDTIMTDGLLDAFYGYPMGNTAENIARDQQVSRSEQDAFALASHRKASAAARGGRFGDEIAPVEVETCGGPVTVADDEHIRDDADLASLKRLKSAFIDNGTVTAANASGINDGAAALVLMRAMDAKARGIAPFARIAASAHAGTDSQFMGLRPIPASRKALQRAGWTKDSVDLWEINEAFAAQIIAVIRELDFDPSRVNVNGGAIALGHPIGASGARVLVTLLHEMRRRVAPRGVTTLCIGGGMGIAMAVERV